MKESIIIIGANGQIGTELAIALRKKFGAENVVTTD
ncbi:MAG TPA: NAD-dependent epimerase, partial [Sphingobacterium sp.]|nr:NAD-dependent epimerase [Sphingobacterium sp.]